LQFYLRVASPETFGYTIVHEHEWHTMWLSEMKKFQMAFIQQIKLKITYCGGGLSTLPILEQTNSLRCF
jgi:hypothetical protein